MLVQERRPPGQTIQVSVQQIDELFAWMDPSPFPHRDLDADIERWIVSWAQDLHSDRAVSIEVSVAGPVDGGQRALLEETFHRHFQQGAEIHRRDLSRLLRDGRLALTIGIAALAGFTLLAQLVGEMTEFPLQQVIQEGFAIAGWVAMWRPMEIFLYDWWPIRRIRTVYQRLATAPVVLTPVT
jgi:hypothetical protein